VKRLYITILFLILSGCSFHSSQLSFVKNKFSTVENSNPIPNWSMSWADEHFDVYAINIKNNIIFADYDNNIIIFNGWQISNVQGLFSYEIDIKMNKNDQNLLYLIEGNIIIDECGDWKSITKNKIRYHSQDCNDINKIEKYNNTIVVSNENIIGLSFRIHPDYPNLILKMNQFNQLEL
jgi:hypothetical protein